MCDCQPNPKWTTTHQEKYLPRQVVCVITRTDLHVNHKYIPKRRILEQSVVTPSLHQPSTQSIFKIIVPILYKSQLTFQFRTSLMHFLNQIIVIENLLTSLKSTLTVLKKNRSKKTEFFLHYFVPSSLHTLLSVHITKYYDSPRVSRKTKKFLFKASVTMKTLW